MASVFTGFPRWRISRFQTHHVRPLAPDLIFILRDTTYKLIGSDVKPCVWAVVEVCLAILGACLPMFPALFRWKAIRNDKRPSGESHSKSADSSQYHVLTPDERRSGPKGGIGNTHKDFFKMTDWADVPKAAEERKGVGIQERDMFDGAVP